MCCRLILQAFVDDSCLVRMALCDYPRVSSSFSKILSASSAFFAAHAWEPGIHRRDAEKPWSIWMMRIMMRDTAFGGPQDRSIAASTGCAAKKAEGAEQNLSFSLRLCGEIPFGGGPKGRAVIAHAKPNEAAFRLKGEFA
jgi:hypothetical protein